MTGRKHRQTGNHSHEVIKDTHTTTLNESNSFHTLTDIFSRANTLLREDGIREGLDRFTEFTHLLFLKLIDEMENEYNSKKKLTEEKYTWESICSLEPEHMLYYINEVVFPYLIKKYRHYGELFNSKLKIRNPENLKKIVTQLSSLEFGNGISDIKGHALEYFIRNSVSVGNDMGEYYTPRHIVELMTDLINPRYGEKVYDPCCGTGGFLLQAIIHMKKQTILYNKSETITGDSLSASECHHTEKIQVWGREISESAKIAVMNMILTGKGAGNITRTDSLEHPVNSQFDIILTNFPFSQKTRFGDLYGLSTRDANPVFLQHVIKALKPGGRAGVVVPDSILFDKTTEYIKVRKYLIETCQVIAIIQLNPFVFKPYTGQPTSILIFKKEKVTENIWFFDVLHDGFKKTGSKKGRPGSIKDDLLLLRDLWTTKSSSPQSFSINVTSVKKKNYTLTMNTYKTGKKRKVPVKTLGEICEPPVIGGTPPRKTAEYWDGAHVWIKIADMGPKYIHTSSEKITEEGIRVSSVKRIHEGTLLMSFKLTLGKVGIAGTDLYTNEAIAGLIPRDKEDKSLIHYLYYILPTIDFTPYAQRAAKGYTLNAGSIQEITVPYPHRSTRDFIVKTCEEKEKEKQDLISKIKKIEDDIMTCITENTE